MRRLHPKGIAIVIMLSVVFFLLGLLGFVFVSAQQIKTSISDAVQMTVYLSTELDEDDAAHLGDSILQMPFVQEGTYVSSEQAWHVYKDELMGESAALFEESPLPSSVEFIIDKANVSEDYQSEIEEVLLSITGVSDVIIPRDIVEVLLVNTDIALWVLVVISIVLLILVLIMLVNTIKLMVYADRFLIHTQQLIGAKESFVIRPYLKKIYLWSISGQLLAVVLLASFMFGLAMLLDYAFDVKVGVLLQDAEDSWLPYILILTLLFIGVYAVMFLATRWATIKQLRSSSNKIYQ